MYSIVSILILNSLVQGSEMYSQQEMFKIHKAN